MLGAGAGLALIASEDLRSKVLDTLFGAEEEFEYTPPPPPSWQGDTFQTGYDPRVADPFGRIISVRGEIKFL